MFLAYALLACAQGSVPVPIDFPDFWKPLREYLQLTSEQIFAINRASDEYWPVQTRLLERRIALTAEIRAETARSPLRPLELGLLHKEWETIRRRLVEAEKARNIATRRLLNPEQMIRLTALEQIAVRREAANVAVTIGLLPIDCPAVANPQWEPICAPPLMPSFNDIPVWSPRVDEPVRGMGALGGSPRLVQYLGLSGGQQQRIDANRGDVFRGAEISRMQTVVQEIREETGQSEPDALALGLAYAEVEALRRFVYGKMRKANIDSLAILTPEQRVKYAALEEAVRLQQTIEEARSVELIGSRCKYSLVLLIGRPSDPGNNLFDAYFGDCPDQRALQELP